MAKANDKGDNKMFGPSIAAVAAAMQALDAAKKSSPTSGIKMTPNTMTAKYGNDPAFGSKAGVTPNSPLSGMQSARITHKHRISRYEFEQLPLEYKQQKMEQIARQVGKEIAEKYMALVETTDGDIEIGIDIEVRG